MPETVPTMQILKDSTKKETRLATRMSSPRFEHLVFMCLISRVTGHLPH
jgi:hypothetical protein